MHSPLHWLAVGGVLLGTLALGVCAHELLHLVPLWFTDAECVVQFLPASDGSTFQNALTGSLVRVEVTHVPEPTPEWLVRGAAVLPLVLALPLALVGVGVLPNPVAAGDHLGTVALLAVTGCGLPSPADWSVVWNGSEVAED